MRSTIIALLIVWPLMTIDQAEATSVIPRKEIVKIKKVLKPVAKPKKKKKKVVAIVPQKTVKHVRPPVSRKTGLTGQRGYAIPYGNCVNEIRNRPFGNPISWPATTQQPYIGAAALFHYNHVGRVVGVWSNGDLEIAHQNFRGNITRFPRSSFRGFR